MLSGAATVSAWVTVDEDCPMQARINPEEDVEFHVGSRSDGFDLLFEGKSLERFVNLAGNIMACPIPADPRADMPELHSPEPQRMTTHEDGSDGKPPRQRFLLTHRTRPTEVYGLGSATDTRVQVMWLDPRTGVPEFGTFSSPDVMLAHVQECLRPYAPLAVRMNDQQDGPDSRRVHDEVVLTKATKRSP